MVSMWSRWPDIWLFKSVSWEKSLKSHIHDVFSHESRLNSYLDVLIKLIRVQKICAVVMMEIENLFYAAPLWFSHSKCVCVCVGGQSVSPSARV